MPLGKHVTSLTDDVVFKTKPLRHPTLLRVNGGLFCSTGMEVLIPRTVILGQYPVSAGSSEKQRSQKEISFR